MSKAQGTQGLSTLTKVMAIKNSNQSMGALRERNLKKVPWVTDSDSNGTWFLSSHAKMMQSKDEVSSLKNSNCDPTQQGFLS